LIARLRAGDLTVPQREQLVQLNIVGFARHNRSIGITARSRRLTIVFVERSILPAVAARIVLMQVTCVTYFFLSTFPKENL
jgi:hypothetical protein